MPKTKLPKCQCPTNHSKNDFECFGPPVIKDGDYSGKKIADLGCFSQNNEKGVDSNKYYHACITKSKLNNSWFVYVEYGRQGIGSPQFQFIPCATESEAQKVFEEQVASKNIKRGQWVNHSVLGQILEPKPGKDLYVVRALETRSHGLPDSKTIRANSVPTKKVIKNDQSKFDPITYQLLRDLSLGTVAYTRGSLQNSILPTQLAIDEARNILTATLKRIQLVGPDINNQINDKEILQLTNLLYSRIPKVKSRNLNPKFWVLSSDNINNWTLDLDSYESALGNIDTTDIQDNFDPFDGEDITISIVDKNSIVGKFIYDWAPKASRNRHAGVGSLKIHNLWQVERKGESDNFQLCIKELANKLKDYDLSNRPLHQPTSILNTNDSDICKQSNTAILFHGTRSCNVSGILKTGLRLPKELVGVATNGAMFGRGLYFGDDFRKSNGYCSAPNSYYVKSSGGIANRKSFMFICNVALGNCYIPKGAHGYTCPPNGYNSIFAQSGKSGVQNNEFIIFNKNQQRLQYLIEFTT